MSEDEIVDLYYKGRRCIAEKQYDDGLSLMSEAAKAGYHKAQYYLSKLYESGVGVKKSRKEALDWLYKAAEQDYYPAKYDLGLKFLLGKDVRKDCSKGIALLQDAAILAPDRISQWWEPVLGHCVDRSGPDHVLGLIFSCNDYVAADYAKALQHFERSARMLNLDALREALTMLERGRGVPVDFSSAEGLCRYVLTECIYHGYTTANQVKAYALRKLRSYADMARYELQGEALTLAEWADRSGVSAPWLKQRLDKHLPDSEVLKSNLFNEQSKLEYKGAVLTIGDWSGLSHIGVRRLCKELEAGRQIDAILDSNVAKVDGKWMYYLTAARARGIPRGIADQWHNDGVPAQEIAERCYVAPPKILLTYNGRGMTMQDLLEMTHLSRHELERRLAANWPAERIVTEPIKPNERIFSQELDIGDVRMEIREWMDALQIKVEDLSPYVPMDKLCMVWNGKTVRAAILDWLRNASKSAQRDYEEILLLLGRGWSWKQIVEKKHCEVPQNFRSLFLCVNEQRRRVSNWEDSCGLTDKDVISCVQDESGTVRWDVAQVQDRIRERLHKMERRRAEVGRIEWRGLRLLPNEWAEKTGISAGAIRARIDNGWHIDDVFQIPYPCPKIFMAQERRYTKEMFEQKFGMPYEEYRKQANDRGIYVFL